MKHETVAVQFFDSSRLLDREIRFFCEFAMRADWEINSTEQIKLFFNSKIRTTNCQKERVPRRDRPHSSMRR